MNIIEWADHWIRYGCDAVGNLITVTTGSEGCYVYANNAELFAGACEKAIKIGEFLVSL